MISRLANALLASLADLGGQCSVRLQNRSGLSIFYRIGRGCLRGRCGLRADRIVLKRLVFHSVSSLFGRRLRKGSSCPCVRASRLPTTTIKAARSLRKPCKDSKSCATGPPPRGSQSRHSRIRANAVSVSRWCRALEGHSEQGVVLKDPLPGKSSPNDLPAKRELRRIDSESPQRSL